MKRWRTGLTYAVMLAAVIMLSLFAAAPLSARAEVKTIRVRADRDLFVDAKGKYNYLEYEFYGIKRRVLFIGYSGPTYKQAKAAVGFDLAEARLDELDIQSIKLVFQRVSCTGLLDFYITETDDDNWTNSSTSPYPSSVNPYLLIKQSIGQVGDYRTADIQDFILDHYRTGDLYLTLLLTSDSTTNCVSILSLDEAEVGTYLEVVYLKPAVTITPAQPLSEDVLATTDIDVELTDCVFITEHLTTDMFSVDDAAARNGITIGSVTYVDSTHAVLRLASNEDTDADVPITVSVNPAALDTDKTLSDSAMSFHAYDEIDHPGVYDLAAYRDMADVLITTTGPVILTQSKAEAVTHIKMTCLVSGVDITLSGVNWNNGDSTSTALHGIEFLGQGNTLTVAGENTVVTYDVPCFCVPAGAELTMQGTGLLTATTVKYAATIGSRFREALGDILVNSGTYNLRNKKFGACLGTSCENGAGGSVTINGGTFDLYADDGSACIGAGETGRIGSVTINGGNITAVSGESSAAIGSGYEGRLTTLTINGGTIYAKGGYHGASIGPGKYGSLDTLTINGGTVYASASSGAAIGASVSAHVKMLSITGGTVYARCDDGNSTAIGASYWESICDAVSISGGLVFAAGDDEEDEQDIGNGSYQSSPAPCEVSITGNAVVFVKHNLVSDRDDDITVPFHGGDPVTDGQVYGYTMPENWGTVGYAFFTDTNPVTGVTLPAYEVYLDVLQSESVSLAAAVEPATAENQGVSYQSSDPGVATVSEAGLVQSVGVGTAVITVTTAEGGFTDTCVVYVVEGITSVAVSPAEHTLYLGDADTGNDSVTLSVTLSPGGATGPAVYFRSGNSAVATVSMDGVVTGLTPGTVDITVSTFDGRQSAVCHLTVHRCATGVSVSPATGALMLGDASASNDYCYLYATVTPADASNPSIQWTSSDPGVATVTPYGRVNALKAGTAIITATTQDGGFEAQAVVTVLQDATGVTLSQDEAVLVLGTGDPADTVLPLYAAIQPEDATETALTWGSDNTAAATVDANGVVTAVGIGAANITVTTANSLHNAVCAVRVYQAATGVSVSPGSGTLILGDEYAVNDSITLTASVTPASAYRQVTWESNHPEIASVDASGVVRAQQAGLATITATTVQGGYTASVPVTVIEHVTGLSVSPATATLVLGDADVSNDAAQLSAAVEPATATLQTVQWASSDTAVATVDAAGKVTGIGRGEARITATSVDGGYTAGCTVTVVQRVTGITIHPTTLTLYLGVDLTQASKALTAAVEPANANNQAIRWESSDPGVAALNMGMVTGRKAGTATITVTSEDGEYTASCAVRVIQEVTQLSVTPASATLVLGGATPGLDTLTLQTDVWPETADDKTVTFFSRNPDIATVSAAGVVTAVKAGTATIVASAVSGLCSGMCTVTVEQRVTGVSLTPSAATLILDDGNPANDTVSLTPAVTPANATNPAVTYASSNPSAVSVSASGVAKALRAGTATVTATTADGGHTASCAITVQQRTIGIALKPQQATLTLGDEDTQNDFAQLTEAVLPGDADNQAVTWATSDPAVAFVDANGQVRALKKGTATITATSADGSYQAACTVTVEYHVMLHAGGHCGKVCLGNCITLTPSIGGGSWTYDSSAVSCNGNTFTPLRAGTTTVTYTLGPAKKAKTLLRTLLEAVVRSAAAQSLETASFTIRTEPLTLKSSQQNGIVETGGTVTLTPNFAGGQWTFDGDSLQRAGNTFTALRDGVTTVSYIYNGQTAQHTLDIITRNPATGDGAIGRAQLYTLLSLAAGLGLTGLPLRRRLQRRGK